MKHRDTIILLAAEVMGARAALAWLEAPHAALGGKRPIDVWDTPAVATKIERLLWEIKDKRDR